MSIAVDFYLLKDTAVQAIALLACRLAEKTVAHHKTAYLCCANDNDVNAIDQLLWTFKEESFIPHAKENTLAAKTAPLVIGWNTQSLSRQYDILINLQSEIPTYWQSVTRILELVAADPTLKEHSRRRYKYYREANCQLQLHEL